MDSYYSPPVRWNSINFKIILHTFFFFSFSSSAPRLLANWTSTARSRQLPSLTMSRYKWALLDLKRESLAFKGHRWTSTGDLPSPLSTAGPQPGDLSSPMGTTGPQLPDKIPNKIWNKIPNKIINYISNRISENIRLNIK